MICMLCGRHPDSTCDLKECIITCKGQLFSCDTSRIITSTLCFVVWELHQASRFHSFLQTAVHWNYSSNLFRENCFTTSNCVLLALISFSVTLCLVQETQIFCNASDLCHKLLNGTDSPFHIYQEFVLALLLRNWHYSLA